MSFKIWKPGVENWLSDVIQCIIFYVDYQHHLFFFPRSASGCTMKKFTLFCPKVKCPSFLSPTHANVEIWHQILQHGCMKWNEGFQLWVWKAKICIWKLGFCLLVALHSLCLVFLFEIKMKLKPDLVKDIVFYLIISVGKSYGCNRVMYFLIYWVDTKLFYLFMILSQPFAFHTGVAIGCGSQGLVAIVNMCSYYVIGIPVGVLLAYAADLEVKVRFS